MEQFLKSVNSGLEILQSFKVDKDDEMILNTKRNMIETRPHWKEVSGYDGLYEVSDYGAVRSLNYRRSGKRKELKPVKDKKGYQRVYLYRDAVGKTFTVHKLVWNAFNGSIPEGKELDHINTIRDDNRLVNLRCVTHKGNCNNPITYKRHLEAGKRRSECPKWQETQREGCKRRSEDPKWRDAVREANAKPILQLDKVTGEVLREWECAMDVERELGVNHRHISDCCNGKQKTAGGYRWQYADHDEKSQIFNRVSAIMNDRGFG